MEQLKKSKYFLEEFDNGKTILLFVSNDKEGYKIAFDHAYDDQVFLSIYSFRDKCYEEESYDLIDQDGKEWCEEFRFSSNGVMYLGARTIGSIADLLECDLFQWITDVRKGANDVLKEYFNKVKL